MRIPTFGHHLLRNLLYSWWHLFPLFLDFSPLNLRPFFACSSFRLRLSAFTFCDCDFCLFFESISTFNLITMLGGLADRSVDADVHFFIIEHLRVGTYYCQLPVTIGLMPSIVEEITQQMMTKRSSIISTWKYFIFIICAYL